MWWLKRGAMQIDLVDLELLIRALLRERRLVHELADAEAEEADPSRTRRAAEVEVGAGEGDLAFYRALDRGDLSDRLTRLMGFFREQKKRYAKEGVETALELRVERPKA